MNQWPRNRFARYRLFASGVSRYLQAARVPYDDLKYAEFAADAAPKSYLPYRTGWSGAAAKTADSALTAMFGQANRRWRRAHRWVARSPTAPGRRSRRTSTCPTRRSCCWRTRPQSG